MKLVDLRSDTVTLPSPSMRKAMYEAELGDDVFQDDPTVNRLEERVASLFGKEASLFVASGTMGNLVALLTHCRRGAQVILGNRSHIYHYEQGGMAALGGIHACPIENLPDGTLDPNTIENEITPDDLHFPRTELICLENTWNGVPLKPAYTSTVAAIAKRYNLKMHLDGARIFNASLALGVPVNQLAREFDSVQFCFSKGLSAPVGSMVCGSKQFIDEARRNRKLVGGGMRQAGVLAAACIVALDEMIDRLAEDHENAHALAEGLAQIPGINVDLSKVQTNMVLFSVTNTSSMTDIMERLKQEGVLVLSAGAQIRAVTHYGIERQDIDAALKSFRTVLTTQTKSGSPAAV